MGIGERDGFKPRQTETRLLFHTVSGYFPNVTRTVRNNLRSGPILAVLIHSQSETKIESDLRLSQE